MPGKVFNRTHGSDMFSILRPSCKTRWSSSIYSKVWKQRHALSYSKS